MAADSILEPEEEPLSIEEEKPISLDDDDEPISLVESSDESEGLALKTIGAASTVTETKFTRPLNTDGKGATRVRIFHSKISEAPLENLEHTINTWIDGDKIEVKHVGQLIGTMEGKTPVPNLLVMVWY